MAKVQYRSVRPRSAAGNLQGDLADAQGNHDHHSHGVRSWCFWRRSSSSWSTRCWRFGVGRSWARGLTVMASLRWYVVHVYSGFEKKVAESIREQADSTRWRIEFDAGPGADRGGRGNAPRPAVNAERKFFPGYVLVRWSATDETWHLVKNTPKVTGFLGTTAGPRRSPRSEAERILRQVQEGVERPKPSVTFEIGEQVRVCDGPFHLVQRHGRGGRRGALAAQGRGVDLRPLDAGRIGVHAGREAVVDQARPRIGAA